MDKGGCPEQWPAAVGETEKGTCIYEQKAETLGECAESTKGKRGTKGLLKTYVR